MIPINKPLIGEEEVKAAVKVLRSGMLTSRTESGSMVSTFQDAFRKFVKSKYAFAVNSGTTALQLSLLASDVGYGDEVIVPSFTFVSTAETVLLVGAKPVFVDIDPDTYNIDPEGVEGAITERTKAVIPVDLYGLPADMKPIKKIAEKHNLVIIEDAAQAHGAEYDGKPCGYYANLACWSFYASKNMTTGEGGMITTNSDEYTENVRFMRSHGEKGEYVSSMIGGNFRMPELEAAIGNEQLLKLPNFLKSRRQNAERLIEKLKDVDRLQLPIIPHGDKHSWYLFTIRMKDVDREKRDLFVKELRGLGIGATTYYPVPIHLMPLYQKFCAYKLPRTEEASNQVFSLPVHPAVTLDQIEYIAASTRKLARAHTKGNRR